MTLSLILTMSLNAADPTALAVLESETAAWHEHRLNRLRAEDGWLTLVGLHWLEEGRNEGPFELGSFTRKGKAISFEPAAKHAITRDGKPFKGGALKTDADGKPEVLHAGSLRFTLIERQHGIGLRIRDVLAKARQAFKGVSRFPVAVAWKKVAKFDLAPAGKTIPIPNVLGDVTDTPLYGTATFTHEGQEIRLVATREDDKLFFVFGDTSNRVDTYGAGRFLYSELPKEGAVTLDFNRAFNPPCAFTAFATCPLPVRENKLTVRIDAGEKRFGDH